MLQCEEPSSLRPFEPQLETTMSDSYNEAEKKSTLIPLFAASRSGNSRFPALRGPEGPCHTDAESKRLPRTTLSFSASFPFSSKSRIISHLHAFDLLDLGEFS